MFKLDKLTKMNTEEKYKYMLIMIEGQLSSEKDTYANLSNVSAIIKTCLNKTNWAGFYFLRDNVLVLGPFQGLPACSRLEIGKGVCGTSVAKREVQIVYNVHEFEGHVACDSVSNSEIVLPIIKNDKVYGVLDIDSPEIGRFTELEKKYLEVSMGKLNKYINWNTI